jgi:Uma2 family endonuclease
MIQSVRLHPMEFQEFLDWIPEDGCAYELYDGVPQAMQPTGPHELVGAFIGEELTIESRRQNLPYTLPKSCLLKPDRPNSGYRPDVILLDKRELVHEPLWQKASTIQFGKTVPLVVEVVSTNWQDDYGHKVVEYEAMGIPELWIVDYRALGAVRYIGKPKRPTITLCQLSEGEYQMKLLVAGQRIESVILPELNLTVDDIFASAIGV